MPFWWVLRWYVATHNLRQRTKDLTCSLCCGEELRIPTFGMALPDARVIPTAIRFSRGITLVMCFGDVRTGGRSVCQNGICVHRIGNLSAVAINAVGLILFIQCTGNSFSPQIVSCAYSARAAAHNRCPETEIAFEGTSSGVKDFLQWEPSLPKRMMQ